MYTTEIYTKVRPKLEEFFSKYPLASRNTAADSPLVLFIVNLGGMHQLTDSCMSLSTYRKSVEYFRLIMAEWLNSLAATGIPRPRVQGFVYGSVPENGMQHPDYSMSEALRVTELAYELLGEKMPADQREFPFPFEIFDPWHALLPRIDATVDGLHYGKTAHHTPVIALLNKLCGKLL